MGYWLQFDGNAEELERPILGGCQFRIEHEGGMDLFPPDQQTAQAASALLRSEIKLWGDVIRANNILAQ